MEVGAARISLAKKPRPKAMPPRTDVREANEIDNPKSGKERDYPKKWSRFSPNP